VTLYDLVKRWAATERALNRANEDVAGGWAAHADYEEMQRLDRAFKTAVREHKVAVAALLEAVPAPSCAADRGTS
jgi:hypothetical protein